MDLPEVIGAAAFDPVIVAVGLGLGLAVAIAAWLVLARRTSGRVETDAVTRFRGARAELDALGLRQRPPAEAQIALGAALAESFERMSRSNRAREQAKIAVSSTGGKILAVSGYLAETAINRNEPAIIRLALMLHVVEGFRTDYRENIRHLVLIAHAARKLGVDLAPLLSSVSAVATPLARKRLDAFSGRADDLNSLASVGVKEEGAPGEFRFVPA